MPWRRLAAPSSATRSLGPPTPGGALSRGAGRAGGDWGGLSLQRDKGPSPEQG